LDPAEDHKGDTYTFWNPITKHVFESRSVIFLQPTYANFHKLEKSQNAKQFATITDELNEMFDEDEDVTPEDEDVNRSPNQINNEDNEEDEDFINITEDMLDSTNPELTYRADDADEDIIPDSVQQKFACITRSIGSLATFYNPNPQDKWENILVEAEVMVRETNEAYYLATVYDGNPEPKNFKEAQNSPDFSNWWESMCIEFRNMEHKEV
jgi:hypothetical protein